MPSHTIASYDADLRSLDTMIHEMAALALASLDNAMLALLEGNEILAQQVISADDAIDRLQHEIEEKAILTIARRQPVAVDLREIIATMRITNDLERIGDLTKNIAKRVHAVGKQPATRAIAASLGNLKTRAREQLHLVIQAHRRRDDRGLGLRQRHRRTAYGPLSRASHLHDGGSAPYRLLRASPFLRQEPGARRRSCHQYCRNGALHDHR